MTLYSNPGEHEAWTYSKLYLLTILFNNRPELHSYDHFAALRDINSR